MKQFKRMMSMVLALAMVLSMLPSFGTHVHAEELETEPVVETTAVPTTEAPVEVTTEAPTENTTEAPEVPEPSVPETTEAPVVTEPSETIPATTEAPVVTEPSVPETTEAPAVTDPTGETEEILMEEEFLAGEEIAEAAVADSTTVVSGLEATWTNAASGNAKVTWSVSGSTITGTAISNNRNTTVSTLSLKNVSGKAAYLLFEYEWTNKGNTYTAPFSGTKGKYEVELDIDAWIEITLETGKQRNKTDTLSITNLEFFVVTDEKIQTTFKPAESGGSYSVSGESISAITVKEDALLTQYALKATPASGYSFFGWYDATSDAYIGYDVEFTYKVKSAATVVPIFVSNTTALFGVGTARFFDLSDAGQFAASGSTKTIVLLNDGTINGSHTIPAGVTLLIPYDASNTVKTTTPATTNSNSSHGAVTAFRTLTMASGSQITVKGAISIGGTQNSVQKYNGMPIGNVGFVKMEDNSTIVVENGAFLYAWGYIVGKGDEEGQVEVKNGGTVYEHFQLADFRGGTATSGMADNDYGVFPMSQYYIQNIEVPLKLYAGAIEKAYMSANITIVGIQGCTIPVVGSEGMFEITSGYIVKDYIEGTGRINFTTAGDITVSSISMSMKLGLLFSTTINSANFNLPIPGHFTINAISGNVTINQDIALLPGAEMYISKGVTGTLASGKSIVLYAWEDWGNYCYNGNASGGVSKYVPLPYPSVSNTKDREKDALVELNGTMDASAGVAYTTPGGANIYSTGAGRVITKAGSGEITYQATQSDTDITYAQIGITPAKLKNAKGSYTETNDAISVTSYVYCSTCGVWGVEKADPKVTNPTCETGGYTTYYCACGHEEETDETSKLPHSYTGTTKSDGDGKDATHSFLCVNGCNQYGGTVKHTWDDGKETTAPGCETAGVKTYTCADGCGATYSETISAIGHNYSLDTTKGEDGYEWSSDGKICTAYGICNRENCNAETTAKANIEYDVTTPATCVATGTTTYTATFDAIWATAQSKNVQDIGMLEHDYKGTIKSDGNGKDATHSFQCVNGCNQYGGAEAHDWNAGEETTAPGCATTGVMTYTCADGCGATYTETILATGHKDENTDHICDNNCGKSDMGTHADSSTDNDHVCDYGCKAVMEECSDAAGDEDHKCDICDAQNVTEHSWKNADCDTPKTCSECSLTEGDALGHSYEIDEYKGITDSHHTAVYVCKNDGSHTYDETVKHDYTYNAETHTCVCGEVESYTVIWEDENGDKITSGTVDHGGSAEAPELPSKPGYSGTWSGSSNNVTGNTTITATYTPNNYGISWIVDGEVHTSSVVTYDSGIVLPEVAPTKTGHTFVGWFTEKDGAGKQITGETIYTFENVGEPVAVMADDQEISGQTVLYAHFTVNSYKVTFNVDGKFYAEASFAYGTAVTVPTYTVPEGHTFSGWTVPATMPAENLTINATLTAINYTVTLMVGNQKYDEFSIAYGEAVNLPTPTKAKEGCTVYTFSGWQGYTEGMTMPAENLTFTGSFEATTDHVKPDEFTYALNKEDNSEHDKFYACCGAFAETEAHSIGAADDKAVSCLAPAYCSVCNSSYGEALAHSYTYTAYDDANTITEECGNGCNHSAVITLAAPTDLTYDGKEKAAVVNKGETFVAEYKLTYNEVPVDTGEYTATLTVGNVSVSVDFTIAKATPEVTAPEGLTATYGQTLADVELPDGWAWADATLSVGNAGVNTFTATYTPENSNYESVTMTVTVNVAKKQLDVSGMSWDVPKDAVYNGNEYTATLTGTLPEGVAVTLSGNVGTNAGAYTAKAVFTLAEGYSADNYEIVNGADLTVDWSIDKATAAYTAPTANALTYNGEKQALITAGTAEGGEMLYKLGDGEWSTTVPEATDAGSYTVSYKVVGDSNHKDTEAASVSVTIAKAKAEITVDTAPITVTYGESVKLPVATTNFGNVTCDTVAANLVDAGTYTVIYTVDSTDNFDGDTKTVQVTINKLAVAEPTASGAYTYNGSEQTVELVGFDDSYMTIVSGNRATNAGDHEVEIALDGNHAWAEGSDGKVQWSIAKAAVTITAQGATTCVEMEPELTYTVEGLMGSDELTTEPTLTVEGDLAVAGEHTITASGADAGSNYTITYVDGKLTVRAHDFEYTDNGDGETHTVTCNHGCGYSETAAHVMVETEVEKPATCEGEGKTTVFACYLGCGHKTGGEKIDPKGHDYQVDSYTDNEDGTHTAHYICKHDGSHTETETVEHTYDEQTHVCACKAVETFTLTFTINGEAYGETRTVAFGAAITAPEYTVPEGHTFTGWDAPETMPAENITLDAALTVNSYEVTFTVNGEEYKVLSFTYGATVTAPEYTAPEGHTFGGWTVPEKMPAGDITLDAALTVNNYQVTFTVNGKEYKVLSFAYGAAVTAPAYDVPKGYTFTGWTVPETMPAGDITLDAELTANTYTVLWREDWWLTEKTESFTYGQDLRAEVTIPENTHLRINGVYVDDGSSAPVSYTYENGVLTILADDLPAADIWIDNEHYVNVTFHANGGTIKPEEGYPLKGDTGFAEDGSYWICEYPVGDGYPGRNHHIGSMLREGWTFTDQWMDATGNVYDGVDDEPVMTDVTLYAQWQCNHDAAYHEYSYQDSEDGSHKVVCACGETIVESEAHDYAYDAENHKCICGDVEVFTLTFYVDGVLFDTVEAEFGAEVRKPWEPKTKQEGCTFYIFDRWTGDIPSTMPGEDMRFDAVFAEKIVHQNVVTDKAVDPTCESTGLTEGSHCEACNTVIVEQKTVDALGHKPGETKVENNVAPDCENDGSYDNVVYCTECGEKLSSETVTVDALGHKDENKDHACDNGCDVYQGTHADTNSDHVCEYGCKVAIGDHADGDSDHICDYGCEEPIGTCADGDKDHKCDYGCGKTYGDHEDTDNDHACEYGCKEPIGTCADGDKDHKCDYGCGKTYGDHVDTDNDHACEYGCKEAIGICEDGDKDHKCDYGCGKEYGDHADTDNDHACEYGCKEAIGTCEDGDKDHKCDYGCGKDYGDHADTDNDHVCEYGCKVAIGICEDGDKDHKCDYGCGNTFGDHADTDNDHACEYGCKEAIGTCADGNKDHKCDYGCGKTFGEHTDTENDGDHVCDYCKTGDALNECYDSEDKDHDCDECGAKDIEGHTEGEVQVENNVAPDCENSGSYDNVVYCTECGEKLSSVTITVDALGHKPGETKVENNVAPDCENDGSYDNVVYCTECGEELSRVEVIVDPIQHNWKLDRHTNNGDTHTEHYICGNDESHTKDVEGLGHDYTHDAENHKCVCGDVEPITITIHYPALAPNEGMTETVTYDYGTTVALSRAAEATGHTFKGYADEQGNLVASIENHCEYTFLTQGAVLTAVYEVNSYDVTFTINGEEYKVLSFTYGAVVTAPAYEVPEGHTFSGWTVPATMPAENITLDATLTVNTYTITWIIDGVETPVDVIFNTMPEAPEATKAADDNFTYEFVSWDKEIVAATEDTAYTAIFTRTGWLVAEEGTQYLVKDEVQKSGWTEIGDAWYYLAPETGVRAEGAARVPYPTEKINGIAYAPNAEDMTYADFIDATEGWFLFGQDGKFQSGTTGIGTYLDATRYVENGHMAWHPGVVAEGEAYYYFTGDVTIGGNIMATGDVHVSRNHTDREFNTNSGVYTFGEDGKLCEYDGITDMAGGTKRYYVDAQLMIGAGLVKLTVDGETKYIYVRSNGELVVNAEYWVANVNEHTEINVGTAAFDENGFMIIEVAQTAKTGVYKEDGKWFYYVEGAKQYNVGLILLPEGTQWFDADSNVVKTAEGKTYVYVRSNAQLAIDTYWVTNTNGDMAAGKYTFDQYGVMQSQMNGIYLENGGLFFYENNQLAYNAGLIRYSGTSSEGVEYNNDWIYVRSNGQLAVGTYWITNTNDEMATGKYVFDENGKMQVEAGKNGIVEENGKLYYYVDGVKQVGTGLTAYGDSYIYVKTSGELAVDTDYLVTNTNGLLPQDMYSFGADGIMII